MKDANLKLQQPGLYHPSFEHDNCGIGAVVNIDGKKSYDVVEKALTIVETLEHRAGKDAKGETGDGVGIMLQISHQFFSNAAKQIGIHIGNEREYGVGMFFFPKEELKRNQAIKMFEIILQQENLTLLGWRNVPINTKILGKSALDSMPYIMQAFIKKPKGVNKGIDFDRKLYIARRVFEKSNNNTYVVSLSSRTIVYKGMFLVKQLRQFYFDLQDKNYTSAIGVVHSRFSTNTNPSWQRAHPNRYIVHNGEINTIRGNADKMLAREETLSSNILDEVMDKILPIINSDGSDSAMLDNTLEFLVMSGMELPLAMMVLIPEPWERHPSMPKSKKDFYQYYASMMEPWDGPASIVFSDGDYLGAILDRNGLRPSRYYITDEQQLILSSEVGVLDIPIEKIIAKGRIEPGKMLLVDTKNKTLINDQNLKNQYANKQPYGKWINKYLINLKDIKNLNTQDKKVELERYQKVFGYTFDDVHRSILPMASSKTDPIGAMGTDSPISVLSKQHKPLFDYFKQQFAQVTNPPIDAIREEVVTSTSVYVGTEGNLIHEVAENCRMIKINNPILTFSDIEKLENSQIEGFKAVKIPITHYRNLSLKKALEQLFINVDSAYKNGANIIIISDKNIDENHIAIPSLLAVSALEQHLVKTKKRTAVSVILESGEPRATHHFATLLGYGAIAVYPYLAHQTIKEACQKSMLNKDVETAINDYNYAILHGIVKIASKMGISTIQSYQSSQIFEAVGIDQQVVDQYFTNTVNRIGGITLEDIEKQVHELHSIAFDPLGLRTDLTLESAGLYHYRSHKEEHLYNPKTIHLLQLAVRNNDYQLYKQYEESLHKELEVIQIRGLFDFNYPMQPISIDEVESVSSIVKRFKTGAMSYGSISEEAHTTLALAMNQLHGKSNSGEGGEDIERILSKHTKNNKNSAIKQVASGRFGVTSEYLVSAEEIQIKMAQGAKPGEGGHLPGQKVYPWIAKTRHSTPGVGLISPPPHHDIYSIEDLAQLIFDLKNANKYANISVKLVSEAGVGTVAAGVVKAGAQTVLISGYDGGTGAAPLSSIYNAGVPWELGLAEAHQTLIMNGLRQKVKLEADGKLMSGRDIAVAAMLGAEEFGFATTPLIALGCVMMRVCNLDTCPVGIATQNPELRKKFNGKVEYVVRFMEFIAQDVRELMAQLGVRSIDELVGRTDFLKLKKDSSNPLLSKLDLHAVLENPYTTIEKGKRMFDDNEIYDFNLESSIDETHLLPLLDNLDMKKTLTIDISNTNRTFGTILGSEITRRYQYQLEDDSIHIICRGSGGQSFGAFIPNGLTLEIQGDSNDYLGKGLSGGEIIVYPPTNATFKADENIIIGNVALYGATSGKVFINGVAGERFCVRNSGAKAVVEGIGDHGLEYMTGGIVVVLGKTGINFAAGMSGGIAYVYDENNDFESKVNFELVTVSNIELEEDKENINLLVSEHYQKTNSLKAEKILNNLDESLSRFKKVLPKDFDKMQCYINEMKAMGYADEKAQIEAFYKKIEEGGHA